MHGLCGWYIPAISIFELDQRMTAVRNSDVIIICGAMMGSAVAWFLASDPAFTGHITVVERDPSLEFASTSHSNSCMRQQFSTEINIRISQFTAAYIRDFKTHMGGSGTVPPRTDYFGYLYLAASDDGARAMRAMHDLQRRLGAATALLEPADLAREFPFMRLDDIRLGSLGLEDEGYFDAEAIRAAWVRGARALGARFITVEVVGFEQDGSGISAVVLGDGAAMDCGYVVNAAGPRAAQVAAMAGMALPVEPRKRYTYVVDAAEPVARKLPLTIDPGGIHMRQSGSGYLIGGAPDRDEAVDADDFDMDHSLWEDKFWPAVAGRVAAFGRVKVRQSWVGHYAFNTFDQNAIIGFAGDPENLYFINGFSGHGLQQAPAMGRGIAELITYGAFRTLDLSALGFDRIAAGRPVVERAII